MSDEIEALLLAGTRPLKSHPSVRDLFGDARAFPVFHDISMLCDVILRKRSLAWPMRFALPPVSPAPPDFAGLACVYCNHLAHAISPHSGDAARKGSSPASEVAPLLTFLMLSAHCLASELPSATLPAAYMEQVKSKLIESARIMRPDDGSYWDQVADACSDVVRRCSGNPLPENEQLVKELSEYLLTLIGLERVAQGEAPAAVYQRGARLVERVARSVGLEAGGGELPRN